MKMYNIYQNNGAKYKQEREREKKRERMKYIKPSAKLCQFKIGLKYNAMKWLVRLTFWLTTEKNQQKQKQKQLSDT